MTRCIYFFFGFITLLSCNHKDIEAQNKIVPLIKELSDLATVEYVVTKIIKANDNKTWFKLGDRKILMSCKASLVAGIDLSKLTKENITVSGKDVNLVLPHSKLLLINIKPEDIKTEYEDVSLFRNPFSNAERDELATQGETQIKNSIDSLGILQSADINANFIITNFLKRLGYQNISITYEAEERKGLF